MAHDFDNTDDIANLDDQELHRAVRDALASDSAIDPDDMLVEAKQGVVTVSGRVGTDQELRIIDHILSDVVGLSEYSNQLVVDPIRRAESPEAIDDHLAAEEMEEGRLLGDHPVSTSDEAAHLLADVRPQLMGTSDAREATESGAPWTPPDGPTPEGTDSTPL